ncbi:zinc finger protein Elbow isoform X1 [Cryptotermes secundus]|uniref:zinc finger protein Elbow isoform X1 n=1 Tax=Cryptotermes secundus TaxID=105785 RepID=UPI000CD7C0C8|nr:zinc finger protein Elbow isoform X1 [Cryptotermes secundus]
MIRCFSCSYIPETTAQPISTPPRRLQSPAMREPTIYQTNRTSKHKVSGESNGSAFSLDAKKSPLALLAQTCSQIGADSPNSKPLIPPLEKPTKNSKADTSREKASPASSIGSNSVCDVVVKSSFKPYESCTRDKTGSPEERGGSASSGSRVRTPVSSVKSNNNTPGSNSGRCSSNHSASSPRSSPAGVGRKTPATSSATPSSSAGQTVDSAAVTTKAGSGESTTVSRTVPSPIANAKVGFTPSLLPASADPALKDIPLGTFKPSTGLPVSTAAYLGGYPAPGTHFPMDVMASSLMSPHHQHLKPGLNPYIGYARMKTPSGADTLVPICRDPYCTGCQLSSHLLAASGAAAAAASGGKTPVSGAAAGPCPGGCAQCDHASAAAAGKSGSFLQGHHNPAAAAAYAHAQLAALAAASHLPYVCSWIAGDAAYCGKRFSNSEELLQHLRTHTNLTTSASDSSATALSLLSPPGLTPTHPLFHRTYPTPPLSPLATARYHPYSKPPLLPPSLSAASSLGFPLHPHPGIPPYFSPYTLYGQRLGAASGMHP